MTIAEQVYEKLKRAPDWLAREVLDFLGYLEAKQKSPTRPVEKMTDLIGVLKGSPSLEGDPVAVQRAMRNEWA